MLKIFQIPKRTFVLQNVKEQFLKIVCQNYFWKQLPNRAYTTLFAFWVTKLPIWDHISVSTTIWRYALVPKGLHIPA